MCVIPAAAVKLKKMKIQVYISIDELIGKFEFEFDAEGEGEGD